MKNNLEFSISNSIINGLGVLLSVTQLVLLVIISNRPITIISSVIYSSILILFFLFSILFHSIKIQVFHSLALSFLLLVPFGLYFVLSFLLLKRTISWVLFGIILGSSIPLIVFNSINSNNLKLLKCLYLIGLLILLFPIIYIYTSISKISLLLFTIGNLLMISSFILLYFDDNNRVFHLLFHIIFILSIVIYFLFISSLLL